MNSSTLIPKLTPISDALTLRVGNYFERHPDVSRSNFLRKALSREIDQREAIERRGFNPPATKAEIRQHAWLEERLAMLQRERRGFWSKLRTALGF